MCFLNFLFFLVVRWPLWTNNMYTIWRLPHRNRKQRLLCNGMECVWHLQSLPSDVSTFQVRRMLHNTINLHYSYILHQRSQTEFRWLDVPLDYETSDHFQIKDAKCVLQWRHIEDLFGRDASGYRESDYSRRCVITRIPWRKGGTTCKSRRLIRGIRLKVLFRPL